MCKGVCLLIIVGTAYAGVLLTTAGSEQRLDTGWTQRIQGGNTQDTIDWHNSYC